MVKIYQVPLKISELGPIFVTFPRIRDELTDDRRKYFDDPEYPIMVSLELRNFEEERERSPIKFKEIRDFLTEQNFDAKLFISVLSRKSKIGKSIRAHSYQFYFRDIEDASLFKLFL